MFLGTECPREFNLSIELVQSQHRTFVLNNPLNNGDFRTGFDRRHYNSVMWPTRDVPIPVGHTFATTGRKPARDPCPLPMTRVYYSIF